MKSYKFDPSCTNPENIVVRERYTIDPPQTSNFYFIIPKSAPYFAGRDMTITHYPSGRVLQPGTDYVPSNRFIAATRSTGLGVYGSITILNHTLSGVLEITYHTIGGIWTFDEQSILEYLTRVERDPRVTSWDSVLDQPAVFPPTLHDFNINDLKGWEVMMPELEAIREAIDAKGAGALEEHVKDYDNPHRVDKYQVGLGFVMNYPVSTLAEAVNAVVNTSYLTPLRARNLVEKLAIEPMVAHTSNRDNPHGTTKVHVGLSEVQNYGIALAQDILLGTSNTAYMTPMRTTEALGKFFNDSLKPHIDNMSNPHGTTKAQVGLGLVENFPMATDELAQQGQSRTHYMSPGLVALYVQEKSVEPHLAHLRDLNNPHGTTKSQVGLSLVPNYRAANDAEATEMLSRTTLMTPYLTRLALQEFMGTGEGGVTLEGHLTNHSNPHRVTAAQVGTYTASEIMALLDDKLNASGTAIDSSKFASMTPMEFVDYVKVNLNLNILELMTPAEIAELGNMILQGKSAESGNSDKLAGKTLDEVVAMANGAVGNMASVLVVPSLDITTSNSHYFKVGEVNELGGSPEVNLLISGGVSTDGSRKDTPPLALLRIDFKDKMDAGFKASIQSLTGNPTTADFFISDLEDEFGAAEGVEIWVRIDPTISSMTVTNLTPTLFTLKEYTAPGSVGDMVISLPSTGLGDDDNPITYVHLPVDYVYSPMQSKHFTPEGDMVVSKVPVLNQSTTGNAATATKLATPRAITFTGGATGTGNFDGSAALSIALTIVGKAPTAGTADAATSLVTGRSINITGDLTYTSAAFNGTGNVTGVGTLAPSGVTAGTYPKVTVDAKGRVTAGAALTAADIPNLDAAKIVSGVLEAARIPVLNQNTTGSAASIVNGLRNFSAITTQLGGFEMNNGTHSLATYSMPWTPPDRTPPYEGMEIRSVACFDTTAEGFRFNKVMFTTNLVATSDRRLKSDIANITDPLVRISMMNGVTYVMDGYPEAGLIADEVEAALAEGVTPIPHDELPDAMGVKHYAVMGLLVEGVKELTRENAVLKSKYSAMEERLERLEKLLVK